MTNLYLIDRSVLAWIADDFESAETIVANVEEELGASVGESKIKESLLRLTDSGDARAYTFNERFDVVSGHDARAIAEPWFRAAHSDDR